MAIRAMVYYTPAQPEVARRALYILQVTRPREVTRVPDVNPITVDTGLRAGVKINYRSDSRANFPTALSELIETIKDFEKLDQGWDSYNGFPMNDSAVIPALEVAIATAKCRAYPSAVPLPTGGIGLRWETNKVELEIDVFPDGLFEGVLEYPETGEVREVTYPASLIAIMPLLNAYCGSR